MLTSGGTDPLLLPPHIYGLYDPEDKPATPPS